MNSISSIKSCVVFGGSRGIGHCISSYFSSLVPTLCVSRTRPLNPSLHWFQADLAEASDFSFVQQWASQHSPTLYLFTVGILGPVGPIGSYQYGQFDQALTLNISVPFKVLSYLSHFISHNDRVVLFSGGGVGGPDLTPRVHSYIVSKFGVYALVDSLSRDDSLKSPIIAIAPGPFPSSFNQEVFKVSPDIAGEELLNITQNTLNSGSDLSPIISLLSLFISKSGFSLNGRLIAPRRDNLESILSDIGDCPRIYKLARINNSDIFHQSIQ